MSKRHSVSLTVNATQYECEVSARTSLADMLRDELGLTATRLGCEHGVCGCCTVLMDGLPVRSCLVLAAQADGHEVITADDVGVREAEFGAVQDAFCETHALQCGYCTSGMMVSAYALLRDNDEPSPEEVDEALGGNVCRCTGYVPIREAVHCAAAKLRAGEAS